ncbi:calcium-binding protein [Clostridium tagluense]|uniref:calcium-binding protein n=1 Tax=Clostridium tagluense TaxID=360422 RepID=UPI001C0AE001|nr:calcium-binding protein [Clostridium tagluense]MBU3127440.1 calcium-binding protein [Clostridium tagluense]
MEWQIHSKQDKRIFNIIKNVPKDDDIKALEAWEDYLNQELKFPFEAEVMDSDYGSSISEGDKLKVSAIGMIDDLHGIIVDVRKGRTKYAFELCLLEALGEDKKVKELVDDYSVWFCNR